jgi:hypothetical protein
LLQSLRIEVEFVCSQRAAYQGPRKSFKLSILLPGSLVFAVTVAPRAVVHGFFRVSILVLLASAARLQVVYTRYDVLLFWRHLDQLLGMRLVVDSPENYVVTSRRGRSGLVGRDAVHTGLGVF